MVYHGISLERDVIEEFCARNAIARLSLFGSVLRDDFRINSDIDILVEFQPDRVPGLFGMAGLELELSQLLGRKVDLRTPAELSRHFRDAILDEAVPQYDASR